MPQFLDTRDPDFEPRFAALLAQKREADPDVDADVAAILADVAARGDAAVIELTARWDRLRADPRDPRLLRRRDRRRRRRASAPEDRAALELAAARIRAYHERQLPPEARWTDAAGAELGWRWTPVDAAGLYVPGGLASYPSSLLMNAIPARVAGVRRLVVCAPTPDGAVNPLVLLAARLAGIDTRLPHRRRPGDRGARLRHRDDPGGGQDHRPRQRLGRRRQAPASSAASAST